MLDLSNFDFSKIEMKLIPNSEAKKFMQKYHYTKSCATPMYPLGFFYDNQYRYRRELL
mgnify:CR=1 FL=1